MTAVLTGVVLHGLVVGTRDMQQPVTFEEQQPSGRIRLRLASGMRVTVTIQVEPVE